MGGCSARRKKKGDTVHLPGCLFNLFKHSEIYKIYLKMKTMSLSTLCGSYFIVIVHTNLQVTMLSFSVSIVINHDCSEGYIHNMAVISEKYLPLSSSRDFLIFRSVLQHLFRQYNWLIYTSIYTYIQQPILIYYVVWNFLLVSRRSLHMKWNFIFKVNYKDCTI